MSRVTFDWSRFCFQGFPVEDRTPSYLFVDNVAASEVVIGLSVLTRWPGMEEKRSSDKDSVAGSSEGEGGSVTINKYFLYQ